ncbi:hypothetical protein [Prochlorothrix hollandica]|nr:hypothetical protein [Prochlorothrix hollandica]
MAMNSPVSSPSIALPLPLSSSLTLPPVDATWCWPTTPIHLCPWGRAI